MSDPWVRPSRGYKVRTGIVFACELNLSESGGDEVEAGSVLVAS